MTNVSNQSAKLSTPLLGEWRTYLDRMRESSELHVGIAEAAHRVWIELARRIPNLEPPHAAPTDDGDLILVWDREQNHFEVEITGGDEYEWFYRDRDKDTYAGEAGRRVGDYSVDFLDTIDMIWSDLVPREQEAFLLP